MSEATLEIMRSAISMRERGVPTIEATKLIRKWMDEAQEALDARDATPKWRFLERQRLGIRAQMNAEAIEALMAVYPNAVI